MRDVLVLLGLFAAWLLVTRIVLPRLGVPT